LVELVKLGKVRPSERDGIGRSPLIFAVDCECPLGTIKQLVNDCGCDVKTIDDNGDSLLHHAVNLDYKELENWLVDDIGMSKEIKNKQGQTPYDEDLKLTMPSEPEIRKSPPHIEIEY